MKRLNSALCAGFLAITLMASPMYLTSCAQTQTAVGQISQQTKDPVALARAAYLDALHSYNDLAERWVKYVPYMIQNHPGEYDHVQYYFGKLNSLLTTWEGFSQIGVIPSNAADDFESYSNVILEILMQLDGVK